MDGDVIITEEKDRKGIFFSHPVTHYDTEFELECVGVIANMMVPIGEDPLDGSIRIFNPNQKWLSNLYQRKKKEGDNPFTVFTDIAISCDVIVGVSFFDGTIGAGVAGELNACVNEGIPAFLIKIEDGVKTFIPYKKEDHRILTIEETRQKTKRGEM
jgi:hypothetical protein